MRMYDIIKKKREGGELDKNEIDFFVDGFVSGDIPNYQIAALLMAIFFKGMTDRETFDLTLAIRDSGETLSFGIDGIRADKHSTGGVGDKTSLIVMPIVASCGIKVAKMSGRGLGHTGGTVDKLESIQGFSADLDIKRFTDIVNNVGLSIVGQSSLLAPADKLLYALRDVTATVDSLPLIASSIMGKKLAANDDCIVIDVKTGSGAFMKSKEESVRLAKLCVDIGKKAGKKISALITDMSSPLGFAIGNSLEVIEAINTLKGNGPSDVQELCLALSAEILSLCGKGDRGFCAELAYDAIKSGKALDIFAAMVEAQGGNKEWIYYPEMFPSARHNLEICAEKSGYITGVDAEGYGLASLTLKAGRNIIGDKIDYAAGITLVRKVGDCVSKNEPIAVLHYNDGDVDTAKKMILASTAIGEKAPKSHSIILGRVD